MALREWRVRWCSAAVVGCVVLCLAVPAAGAKTKPRHRHPPAPAAVQPKTYTGQGFDACTAPALPAMATWWKTSGYHAAGIYIGGPNRACPSGNLSPGWVRSVSATGWRLMPIYVGLQAPCAKQPRLRLMEPKDLKALAAQANAAADEAVTEAVALGLLKASPLYFDLEAYPRKNPACTAIVLSFLNTWTRRLHTHGYLSGLYGSAGSGIADLVAVATKPGTTPPDALWIAHWDDKASVQDPAVPGGVWTRHQRIKQYAGGHTEAHGGITLNIDKDYLDGPVARTG
jgi:hypothetical protein